MSVKSRIGLLVEAQGARRAAGDVDKVARSTNRLGDESAKTGRKMRSARTASVGLARGVRGLAAAGTVGAAAAVGLGVAFGKNAVMAWEESRKVAAGTTAVIKSTGGAAKVTANHVANLAGETAGLTGVDDETIQSGANMLLTFKNIRNEAGKGNKIFDESVGALTDMSVAMGKEPRAAAIMLGKALNDPIKGVTALGRAGVQLDSTQTKNIETMVKQGDLMGAQKILLGELESQFGGQAKAQGTALDKMKVSWGNLEEAVGSGLQPVTDEVFKSITAGVNDVTPILEGLGEDISRVFGRDDLSLEQKLGKSARMAQRDLGPLVDDMAKEIKSLMGSAEFGETIGKGFETAAPYIANHAAQAAPRVVGAFVNAWLGADFWGKLVTVGFLAGKMGAFRGAGGWAAGRFATSFGRGLPTSISAQEKSLTKSGRVAGGFVSAGMAAAVVAAAPSFWEMVGDTLGLGPDFKHEAQRGFRDLIPGMEEDAGGPGDTKPENTVGVLGPDRKTTVFIPEPTGHEPSLTDRPRRRPRSAKPRGFLEPIDPTRGGARMHPEDISRIARELGRVVNDKNVILSPDVAASGARRGGLREALKKAPV